MTEVTLLEPVRRDVVDVERENKALRDAVYRERTLRLDQPRVRLKGWHIVVMVLGGIFMGLCFLWSVVQFTARQSQIAADRSHELALKAIENTVPVAASSHAEPIVYFVAFLCGLCIMLWCAKQAGAL